MTVILRMEPKTARIQTNATRRWCYLRAEARWGLQRDQGDPIQD